MWCAPLFQPEERSSLVGQVQQSGEFWRLEKKVEALLAEVKSRVRTADMLHLKRRTTFICGSFSWSIGTNQKCNWWLHRTEPPLFLVT